MPVPVIMFHLCSPIDHIKCSEVDRPAVPLQGPPAAYPVGPTEPYACAHSCRRCVRPIQSVSFPPTAELP